MAPGPGATLIERETELDVIGSRLAEVAPRADPNHGVGGLTIIRGEAGIGKSALLAAARVIGQRHGLQVIGARGAELEQEFSFGVVRQLIEPWLIPQPDATLARLRSGAAALAGVLFPPLAAQQASDAEPDFPTLHGLYWLLASLSADRPVAMLIDDLQWCDEPSLRFLQFLLRRGDGLALTILAAVRTGEPAPVAGVVEELLDESSTSFIDPAPLSRDGITQLIGQRRGSADNGRFAASCHEATGGNPFYALAMLDQAATDLASAKDIAEVRGPEVVVRSVARRLNRLGPDAAALAEAVAVLGDGRELRTAAALAGLELARARAAARALERAAILRPEDQPAFAHAIVRAAVISRIAPEDRCEQHAAAARLLGREQAPDELIAAQLMGSEPGTVEQGAETLLSSAATALRRGAPEIAARYFARAALEPLSATARTDALLAQGRAEIRCGNPAALPHLVQAREDATDPAQRVEAALLLTRLLYMSGAAHRGVAMLSEEEDQLGSSAPELAHAIEDELLSLAALDLSVRPLVRARLARLTAAPGPGDGRSGAISAQLAIAGLMDGGDAAQAAQHAHDALAAGELQKRALLGDQLFFVTVFVLTLADRFGAADHFTAEMVTAARRTGSAITFAAASTQRAMLALMRGDLTTAEADARAALDIATLNCWPPVVQLALAPLMYVLLEREGPGAARESAVAAGIDLNALDPGTQGNVLLEARGRLALADGRPDAAVTDLLAAGEQFTGWGVQNPSPFPWRSRAAIGLAQLGERDRAAALADEELALARRWGAPRAIGVALRARGRISSGGEQIELFEAASETLQSSGAELELAHALADLGAALRRTNRRAESRAPLRGALELAVACGAKPLAHRAHTELWATGARPRRPVRTGFDALTPSELRVAGMAASGRSNPDIAQDLFITVKTVETHLSNSYRKLSISNRSQLAAALPARTPP